MKTYLVCCPTHRDLRELSRLSLKQAKFLCYDYASVELENHLGANPASALCLTDPLDEIKRLLARFEGETIDGVVSTDDHPGSTLACVVAQCLKLPAPDPAVNLLCQHKYYSRLVQRRIVPEAVPEVALIDVQGSGSLPHTIELPAFIKPVKSFFSVGAQRLSSAQELRDLKLRWQRFGSFFQHFERLLEPYTGLRIGSEYLIVEECLQGSQVTLEGYAWENEVYIMGIVDSVMFPGTIAFERFEYPSSLPPGVQLRMQRLAKALMNGLGYRNGMFNMELMYDHAADRISIIEINPRPASQFADLYEKVDGFNSYSVMLDLAAGLQPKITTRAGPHRMAASCVLRTFEDKRVVALPTGEELQAVAANRPDVRIELLATEGRCLSDEMQDGHSFRYGIISLGGRDRGDILANLENVLSGLTFRFQTVSMDSPRLSCAAELW